MAAYNIDGLDMCVCPYFPEHKNISGHRFHNHLLKCSERSDAPKLEICPYNTKHRYRKMEMAEHFLVCPDKEAMSLRLHETDIMDIRRVSKMKSQVGTRSGPVNFMNECWDDDMEEEARESRQIPKAKVSRVVPPMASSSPSHKPTWRQMPIPEATDEDVDDWTSQTR